MSSGTSRGPARANAGASLAQPGATPGPSRLWASAGFGGATEEFDALTDLFLGEVAGRGGAAPAVSVVAAQRAATGIVAQTTGTAATRRNDRQPGPPDATRPFIECVVLGHLPVLASAWASQYVREVAQAAASSVAFVRVQSGFATIELVGDSAPRLASVGETDRTLEEALREAAGATDRWIVRADPGEEADIAARPAIRMVTLLTGPDEAARVGAYGLVKTLAKHLPPPEEGSGPLVRLAVMSAPEQKGDEAGTRLAEVVRQFLGRDVQHAVCSSRIRAARPTTLLFSGRTDLPAATVLEMLESVAAEARPAKRSAPAARPSLVFRPADEPVREPEPVTKPEPAARPDPSDAREPVAPAASAAEPRGDAAAEPAVSGPSVSEPEPARPPAAAPAERPIVSSAPADGLCAHLSGLSPIAVRCPYADGVEIATDASGVVHLLANCADADDERTLASLMVASSWADAHAPLLAACVPGLAGGHKPVLHLFTSRPKSTRRLLETSLRVHLLTSVAVEGRTGWACVELN